MTIRKAFLSALAATCFVGLCSCESTKMSPTGYDANGEESAFDKQTDLDNAEASKLDDVEEMDGLEQMDVPNY